MRAGAAGLMFAAVLVMCIGMVCASASWAGWAVRLAVVGTSLLSGCLVSRVVELDGRRRVDEGWPPQLLERLGAQAQRRLGAADARALSEVFDRIRRGVIRSSRTSLRAAVADGVIGWAAFGGLMLYGLDVSGCEPAVLWCAGGGYAASMPICGVPRIRRQCRALSREFEGHS